MKKTEKKKLTMKSLDEAIRKMVAEDVVSEIDVSRDLIAQATKDLEGVKERMLDMEEMMTDFFKGVREGQRDPDAGDGLESDPEYGRPKRVIIWEY